MAATQPRTARGTPAPSYYRPKSVAQAVRALARDPKPASAWLIVAGGTDVYPARVGRVVDEPVLDISGIHALRGIRELPERFDIGAGTTWSDVVRATLPPLFDGLKLAAREVGGVQIQGAGTVGGNLCNASPAADGVPPLLALGAEVELVSPRGARVLPLQAFLLGNRKTARQPDELMTAVRIPKPPGAARSGFVKLGSRKYLVISIVMAAAVVEADAAGRVSAARVAVGACSPVAERLPALEAELHGRPMNGPLGAAVLAEHLAPLTPLREAQTARSSACREAQTAPCEAKTASPPQPGPAETAERLRETQTARPQGPNSTVRGADNPERPRARPARPFPSRLP
jgi:CO/xanthine dehydrogenase FAD-binding subunit